MAENGENVTIGRNQKTRLIGIESAQPPCPVDFDRFLLGRVNDLIELGGARDTGMQSQRGNDARAQRRADKAAIGRDEISVYLRFAIHSVSVATLVIFLGGSGIAAGLFRLLGIGLGRFRRALLQIKRSEREDSENLVAIVNFHAVRQ